jgi:hypothetical protein
MTGGSFRDNSGHYQYDDYQYQNIMSDEDNNRGHGSSDRGGRLLRLKNNYSVGPAETLSMG